MEDVVIAGMSGKLPESENMEEFWANLIGGVDMVTDDDRRWKAGEWGVLRLPSHVDAPLLCLLWVQPPGCPEQTSSSLSPSPNCRALLPGGASEPGPGRLRANPGVRPPVL